MSRVGTEPRSPTYQSLSFGFSLGCWGWDTGVQSTLTVIVRRQRVASTVSPVKRLSESLIGKVFCLLLLFPKSAGQQL